MQKQAFYGKLCIPPLFGAGASCGNERIINVGNRHRIAAVAKSAVMA